MQQTSTSAPKLSNKFDQLQSLQNTDFDPEMNKKKEAEYQAQIQNLESTLQKWNRAKLQRTEKEKKLEGEKLTLLQRYEKLREESEQRNNDLQRQIDNLKSLVHQHVNDVDS